MDGQWINGNGTAKNGSISKSDSSLELYRQTIGKDSRKAPSSSQE